MQANRSMPPGPIIPELAYSDVPQAARWLCAAFGFRERLRIGDHRVQLGFAEGSIVAIEGGSPPAGESVTHRVMVRVDDVDRHHERARAHGILSLPTDYPFGERQYSAQDPAGHRWVFSQTIADVDPRDWGGEPVDLA